MSRRFAAVLALLLSSPFAAQAGSPDFSFSPVDAPNVDLREPVFEPEAPAVGQTFVLSMNVDRCLFPEPNPAMAYSEVRVQSGRRIDVLFSVWDYTDPCNVIGTPPGPLNFRQELPGLDEGNWTVQTFMVDYEQPFPMDLAGVEPFASAEVQVRGEPTARGIPTLHGPALLLLILVLSVVGIRRLHSG